MKVGDVAAVIAMRVIGAYRAWRRLMWENRYE
jgi:hypothetical protein